MNAIKTSASLPSLDGSTLETMVTQLSENMGWEAMSGTRCFYTNDTMQVIPDSNHWTPLLPADSGEIK